MKDFGVGCHKNLDYGRGWGHHIHSVRCQKGAHWSGGLFDGHCYSCDSKPENTFHEIIDHWKIKTDDWVEHDGVC